MTYLESKPTRLLAFPRNNKDGKAKPIIIELPPQIIFHFGNAFEINEDKLVFEVVTTDNKQLLEKLRIWKKDQFGNDSTLTKTWGILERVTVDLKTKSLVSNDKLAEYVEFPRYDLRLTAKKSQFLYLIEDSYGADAKIVRVNLEKQTSIKINAGKTRTYGEPVFVPRTSTVNEERGWILAQGYDGDKNESFLEIRDAQTLEFASRIWAKGLHFPLGFHGNFYPAT